MLLFGFISKLYKTTDNTLYFIPINSHSETVSDFFLGGVFFRWGAAGLVEEGGRVVMVAEKWKSFTSSLQQQQHRLTKEK